MTKYIFRKEYFGALLYDPKRMYLQYLDEKESHRILSDKNYSMIIHQDAADHFLSAPLKVFMGLSSRCNLKCMHCVVYDPRRPVKEIDYENVKRIFRELGDMGVLEVRLSGGEPTCRKDFFRIVKEARKNHLTVSVNSNGVYHDEIRECIAGCGIDRLHISLDGLENQNDRIRGKGVFKKVISSIKFLREKGQYIRIVVCLYKNNIPDIDGLIRLAEEMDCDMKFSPIARAGKAKYMGNLLSPDDCLGLKRYFDHLNSRVNVFFNFGTMIPEFNNYCQLDDFDSTICGSGRTQLRVELSGDIYGAGCGDVDESKLPLGTKNDPIKDIWYKAQFAMLQEMNNKGGRCLDCDFPKILTAWLNHASPSFNFKRKDARTKPENNSR
jgi:MoaA/NifB/PqqE/SkfB family radical SAM enzyme